VHRFVIQEWYHAGPRCGQSSLPLSQPCIPSGRYSPPFGDGTFYVPIFFRLNPNVRGPDSFRSASLIMISIFLSSGRPILFFLVITCGRSVFLFCFSQLPASTKPLLFPKRGSRFAFRQRRPLHHDIGNFWGRRFFHSLHPPLPQIGDPPAHLPDPFLFATIDRGWIPPLHRPPLLPYSNYPPHTSIRIPPPPVFSFFWMGRANCSVSLVYPHRGTYSGGLSIVAIEVRTLCRVFFLKSPTTSI